MKNIANNKTVQRMEWIKTNTVVITYTCGSKETMSRATFNQIIKGQGMSEPFFKATLPMPPSVNHYWGKAVRYKNGKPYVHVYLTAKANKFRSDVIAHVASLGRIRTQTGRIKAVVTLHGRTKADYDIDNYSKGLFDALTHALVYKDDSLIHATEFRKGEVIKGGRVEVELYELNT